MKHGWLLPALLCLPLVAVAAARDIVSLDLCSDWMLLRLGGQDRVRAFSPLLYRYRADWVPEGLPQHDGRLESLLPLGRVRFVAGEYNAMTLRQRLRQLGRSVEAMPLPQRLDEVVLYTDRYRQLLGQGRGGDAPETHHPANGQRLLLLGANAIGTGRDTLESDIVERAGFANYLQSPGFRRLDLERLVADPPDAILWSAPRSRALAYRLAEHPLIRARMASLPEPPGEDWRWMCPGPWSFDLVADLAAWGGRL